MTQTATSPQRKPLLDEASFQQLLSAAYVLQEHNDRLRAKGVHADFAENLSAIVETQKLIQTLQLDLAAAAELVAERVQKITNASGTAIGILEKGQLFYRAATGTAAIDAGSHVAPESALSADCLSRGSALNYPDVTPSLHVNSDRFRGRSVKAFIAVPVYHAGQVAGVLELRFARANSFRESDLRAAELMAGLLSEAMVTAARMKWKEALASERQSMLEALERIKPQIERLGSDSPSIEDLVVVKPSISPAERPPVKLEAPAPRSAVTCSACGSDFFDESESFCGICGSARPVTPPQFDFQNIDAPSFGVLNKPAPWLTPYGQENPSNGSSGADLLRTGSAVAKEGPLASMPAIIAPELQPRPLTTPARNIVEERAAPQTEAAPKSAPATASSSTIPVNPPSTPFLPATDTQATDSLRIVPADPLPNDQIPNGMVPNGMIPADLVPATGSAASPWGSARKTQQWLENVKTHRGPGAEWLAQQWQRRRANIYVVVAAIILLSVISGWGIRPGGTTTAGNAATSAPNAPQQQAPAQPQLTLFEKLMISLGLAEPPPAPIYMGNPDTQVWVDVHTALYYCPGSDLYGKTADGKFASQKDAQQDQFEPANRKACP